MTAPALGTLLEGVREAGVRYLALNLREVDFLAGAGLRVLVRADRRFRAAPGWLVLTHPTEGTRRVLQCAGLDSVLTVHPYRHPAPPDDRADQTLPA